MTDWLGAVSQLRSDGEAGVLVTVVAVRGHAPRDAGAKMVVSAERTWGSVGGGNLEQTAVDRARELLASGVTTPETHERRLNEHARTEHGRQCCGGVVTLSPDGRYLVSTSDDAMVRVWDRRNPRYGDPARVGGPPAIAPGVF